MYAGYDTSQSFQLQPPNRTHDFYNHCLQIKTLHLFLNLKIQDCHTVFIEAVLPSHSTVMSSKVKNQSSTCQPIHNTSAEKLKATYPKLRDEYAVDSNYQ